MKTYSTHIHTAELAFTLARNGKPFHFDGEYIEFMATEDWVKGMVAGNEKFQCINFRVK